MTELGCGAIGPCQAPGCGMSEKNPAHTNKRRYGYHEFFRGISEESPIPGPVNWGEKNLSAY